MKVMHGQQQQPSGIVDDDAPLTAPPPRFMLHPTGTFRTAWDVHVFCYVVYIAFAYPFYLSFDVSTSREMQVLDWIIDVTFGVDILLNFNTGYVTHEVVITRRDLVARNYLRSWFVLDFMSTVPLEMILGPSFSDFNAAKVLKIGKLFRGLKMLRISKLVKLISSSGLAEIIEEFMVSLYAKVLIDFVRILGMSFIICHFMACFMALSGDGFLEQYMVSFDGDCCAAGGDDLLCDDSECRSSAADWPTSRKYLAAMYWALTTMATVGYGDITPQTDAERIYAMMATGMGCVFFSYVIGIIAGLVAATDANSRAYNEKMAVVNAWLNFNHLPKSLRRKVRNYFKSFLQERTALDEQAILNDLDPGLRQELGSYLTPAVIRHSSLFGDLSPTILGKVNPILRPVSFAANDIVQHQNDPGTSMHVVVSGEIALSHVARSSGKGILVEDHHVVLGPGETFGELVALSVIPKYEFTAVALIPSALYEFDQVHLFEALSSMPEVIEKLRTVAIRRRREFREKMNSRSKATPPVSPLVEEDENSPQISAPHLAGDQPRRLVGGGGSTLVGGGSATLPVGYADHVLDKLSSLDASLKDISTRLEKLEERHAAVESC